MAHPAFIVVSIVLYLASNSDHGYSMHSEVIQNSVSDECLPHNLPHGVKCLDLSVLTFLSQQWAFFLKTAIIPVHKADNQLSLT